MARSTVEAGVVPDKGNKIKLLGGLLKFRVILDSGGCRRKCRSLPSQPPYAEPRSNNLSLVAQVISAGERCQRDLHPSSEILGNRTRITGLVDNGNMMT
ncbi:hypothetical protein Y1Q_0022239 [Alligator mississippiensis]|uniref:Uncharacterized protein n=1 Tax=Alligator mississippiensis TaxID=8496 RepID=A0A151P0F7_ALLMI|nr:hypothetical protein Y1Q_0022239 [Alligator mississippiensis]